MPELQLQQRHGTATLRSRACRAHVASQGSGLEVEPRPTIGGELPDTLTPIFAMSIIGSAPRTRAASPIWDTGRTVSKTTT